jgi:beta-N-acetylhexosaminidase
MAGLAGPAQAGESQESEEAAWIRQTIAGMTTEEKVGQLFVAPLYGTAANTPDDRNTAAYGVATPAEVVS